MAREDVHNALIKSLVSTYRSAGYSGFKVAHIGGGYEQPNPINNQIPDITAFDGSVFVVAEAETVESISTQETLDQWTAFSDYTKRIAGKFHVVVPKSCLEDAQKFAQQNGVRVDKWYYDSDY